MRMTKQIIQHSRQGIESWSPKGLLAPGKREAHLDSVISETPEILGIESFRSGIQGSVTAFCQLNQALSVTSAITLTLLFLKRFPIDLFFSALLTKLRMFSR